VRLKTEAGTQTVYVSPGEAFFNFADAYWGGEQAVAIVVTGTARWNLAFSVPDGRQLPFERFQRSVQDVIRRDYALPASQPDAIQWTWTAEAADQFHAKHQDRELR
jgi:hypothetical protein